MYFQTNCMHHRQRNGKDPSEMPMHSRSSPGQKSQVQFELCLIDQDSQSLCFSNTLGLPFCGLAMRNCWRGRIYKDLIGPLDDESVYGDCLDTCQDTQFSVVSKEAKPLEVTYESPIYNYLFRWKHQNIMSFAQLSEKSKGKSLVRER